MASMTADRTAGRAQQLKLQSLISDMELLWPWVDEIAAAYAIPNDLQFAIHLCLEEAVSNVIRHGYGADPGHPVTVNFTPSESHELVFTVIDEAPPFNPLEMAALPDPPPPSSVEQLRPGGQGIRLMRKFAGGLTYERLPGGNRLTIRFTNHS